jgi:hypothetical protein
MTITPAQVANLAAKATQSHDVAISTIASCELRDKASSMADLIAKQAAEIERLRGALEGSVRAAELALFVVRKEGVMPRGNWEKGFTRDLGPALSILQEQNT